MRWGDDVVCRARWVQRLNCGVASLVVDHPAQLTRRFIKALQSVCAII